MSRRSTAHESTPEIRSSNRTVDVLIVGGGVSGLTGGVFTARAGLETLIVNDAESILRRNAHLENCPGFPAGVNSRLFLEMLEEQARRVECELLAGRVTAIEHVEGGDARFRVALENGETLGAERVIAASWSDASYLGRLDVEIDRRGTDSFVVERDNAGPRAGRTGVEGLYVAGRLSGGFIRRSSRPATMHRSHSPCSTTPRSPSTTTGSSRGTLYRSRHVGTAGGRGGLGRGSPGARARVDAGHAGVLLGASCRGSDAAPEPRVR